MAKQPIKYYKYVSEDFKVKIPIDTRDIPNYLLEIVNLVNPDTTYIIDEYGEDWVTFIDINDPQNTISFTKQ